MFFFVLTIAESFSDDLESIVIKGYRLLDSNRPSPTAIERTSAFWDLTSGLMSFFPQSNRVVLCVPTLGVADGGPSSGSGILEIASQDIVASSQS